MTDSEPADGADGAARGGPPTTTCAVDLLDALDRANGEFRNRLEQVRPDDWSRPTPCDEWDVRFLVAHVVGGSRFAASVLSGSSARAGLSGPTAGSGPTPSG